MFELRDRDRIERHLRRAPELHIYELGDLDPFYWPYTRWWAAGDAGDEPAAIALLYRGGEVPTLLLFTGDVAAGKQLLGELRETLPAVMNAHLSPGLIDALLSDERRRASHHGLHRKMTLTEPSLLDGRDVSNVAGLGPGDLSEILALYDRAYPGNWFDPRMLETGRYVGVREAGELRCIAGIHVYSPAYGVAALGNITTDPDHRGRGLALAATAHLCRLLLEDVDTIGLNVKADNAAAIACYRKLGFTFTADYDEYSLRRPVNREAIAGP